MKKYLISVLTALAILSGCAPAYAGPSAGIVQSLFVQNGAGAVPRPFAEKLKEQVSIKDFGAKCDGTTNDAPAVQKAIDSLPSGGGTIRLPDGECRMLAGVNFTKNLRVVGGGKFSTILRAIGGNGGVPFFNQTGAADILAFEAFTFAGNGTTAGPIYDAGSIAYSSANNSYSENVEFVFWQTISTWKGGYYHKHVNSNFEYSQTLFSGYTQNNVAFVGCRWSNFQTGMTIVNGEGPVSFTGGSIEYWSDKAFTSTTRQIALTMTGAYVENGATAPCPTGITCASGKYDSGVLVYSNGPEIFPIVLTGNTIFTPGIFRLVYFDSAVGSHLIAKGNNFIARGLGPTSIIYNFSGASTVAELHDEIVGALPAGAVYTSGLPADLEGSSVWDPVARKQLRPTATPYTNLTLQNGFTNSGGTFSNVGYVQLKDGTVRLRGVVNGSAATAAVIATLPAGSQPTNVKVYSVASASGAGAALQLLIYPSGAIVLNGAAPFANQIGLDGVTFRPGE